MGISKYIFRTKSAQQCWKLILTLHASGFVITCTILLLGWWMLDYRSQCYEQLASELNTEAHFQQKAAQIRCDFENTNAQLNMVNRAAFQLLERIPTQAFETDFLKILSQLSRQTYLDVQDFRPGRIYSQAPLQCMDIQLRGQGTYASICRFVSKLSTLPRICRITQINIQEPKTAGGSCGVDIQMQLMFGKLPLHESFAKLGGK